MKYGAPRLGSLLYTCGVIVLVPSNYVSVATPSPPYPLPETPLWGP
jgi:hypothetical protein